MKKFLSLVLAVIIAASMFVTAYADVDGPDFITFTVFVSNPSGISAYDYSDDSGKLEPIATIPANTELEIRYEFMENDALYGSVMYKNDFCYIKMSDVTLNKPQVGLEVATKLEKPRDYVILNRNGAELREGPALSYNVLSVKIPYGTVLKIEYFDSEYNPYWGYITYDSYSGWVSLMHYNDEGTSEIAESLLEEDDRNGKVLTLQNADIEDLPGEKVIGTIPAGKILDYKYITYSREGTYAYVQYKNAKGWLDLYQDSVAVGIDETFYVNDENGVNIYSEPVLDDSYIISNIPSGNVFSAQFKFYDEINLVDDFEIIYWYKITYNGSTGWVNDLDYSFEYAEDLEHEPSQDVTEETTEQTSERYEPAEFDQPEEETTADDEETTKGTKKDDKKLLGTNKMSPTVIIIICVAGAIIVALSAVIIVLLINKKKS